MNTVVTINVGDYWRPNAKASVVHAARRWGCRVVEIPTLLGGRDVFHAKFFTGQFCHQEGRCLWLDADMVIREDCPSPFDLVSAGHFGAVLNYQGDTHRGDPGRYQRESWEKASAMLGIDRPYSDAEYINGGLILFGPEHLPQMELAAARLTNSKGIYEQAAWSVLMADYGRVTCLPREFNRIGPAVWESGPQMSAYVYHFASYMDWRGAERKAAMIDATNWRTTPGGAQ